LRGVVKIVMVVKYHTLAFKSWRAGGVEEMSGGDTSMAGVGKAQAEELAGMTNELKRKLRELTAEQLGRSQN